MSFDPSSSPSLSSLSSPPLLPLTPFPCFSTPPPLPYPSPSLHPTRRPLVFFSDNLINNKAIKKKNQPGLYLFIIPMTCTTTPTQNQPSQQPSENQIALPQRPSLSSSSLFGGAFFVLFLRRKREEKERVSQAFEAVPTVL